MKVHTKPLVLPALLFFLSLLLIAIQGCAPVADPHKGGLFGYSPELYEQRAAQKRQRLQQLENEKIRAQQQQGQITADLTRQKAALAGIKQKTAALEADLATLQKLLSGQQQKTAASQKKKQQLAKRLAKLEKEAKTLYSDNLSLSKKQKRIQELEKEKKRLQQEAELLSTMY